ncbi:MAG: ferredoxin reductase [Dehalococcoidia bacterium]|nr:oxidoreductase [Chloroflexota bacterium]MDP6056913.1 ferredoxin reductase [Dehalococcoidia bacterium]MDP7484955.1 ferredoxin reductase [Dehalococcoidia bacterium]
MSTDTSLDWQIATVTSVHDESPRVKSFRFDLPKENYLSAGQYFDVRLTAPDGYQTRRSYSITSSPESRKSIELAIELIAGGEVSSYFHEVVQPGDKIEVQGPIGGYFTWDPSQTEPILLIAGGTGIAPLVSMLRHRQSSPTKAPTVLMVSARTEPDLLFRKELQLMEEEDLNFDSIVTLTRKMPKNWLIENVRENRRIDLKMIETAINRLGESPSSAYVCGGTGFVESIGNHLLEIGMAYTDILTERFGP